MLGGKATLMPEHRSNRRASLGRVWSSLGGTCVCHLGHPQGRWQWPACVMSKAGSSRNKSLPSYKERGRRAANTPTCVGGSTRVLFTESNRDPSPGSHLSPHKLQCVAGTLNFLSFFFFRGWFASTCKWKNHPSQINSPKGTFQSKPIRCPWP